MISCAATNPDHMNGTKFTPFLSALLLCVLFNFSALGQITFLNPSFEEGGGGFLGIGARPYDWPFCNGSTDWEPGTFNNQPASHGNKYLGFWNGGSDLYAGIPVRLGEGSMQELFQDGAPCPLKVGKTYTFTFDLMSNPSSSYNPGNIAVVAGFDECDPEKLLWRSDDPGVGHVLGAGWQTHEVLFTADKAYTWIGFYAIYNGQNGQQCSVDNLSTITKIDGSVASTNATCANGGTISYSPTPGFTGPFTYTWLESDETTVIAGLSGPTATNLAPGTYVLKVVDQSETCPVPSFFTVNITGVEPITGTATVSTSPVCEGQTAQFNFNTTVVRPLQYSWSPAAGLNNPNIKNPTFSGTASQTYTLTVSDPNDPGCTKTYTVDVTVSETNAGTPSVVSVCQEAAPFDLFAQLGGTPQTGGTWTRPGGAAFTNPFNPSTHPAGSYTYRVQNGGCPAETATITVSFHPNANAGNNNTAEVCETNTTFNLNSALNGNPTGGTWSAVVGQSPMPSIFGGNIVNPSSLGAGTFYFNYVVASPNGCVSDTALLTLMVGGKGNAGADANMAVCNVFNRLDLNEGLSADADTDGEWSGQGGLLSTILTSLGIINPLGIAPGTYPYYYVVESDSPCPADTAVINVTIKGSLEAGNQIPGAPFAACNTDASVNVPDYLENNDGGGNWELVPGSVSPGTVTNNGAWDATSAAGNVSLAYIIKQANGCPADTAVVDMLVVEAPNAGADGLVETCNAFTSALLVDGLSGADVGGTWVSAEGLTGLNTATGEINVDGLTAGTYTFYYIVAGTAPCQPDTAVVELVVNEKKEAGVQGSNPNAFCDTESEVDINSLLSGQDAGGTWVLLSAANGTLSSAGVYTGFSGNETVIGKYVVPAGNGCPADSADVVIQVVAAPNAGENGSVGACNAFSSIQLSPALSGADAGGTWVSADGLGGLNASTGEIAVAGVPSGTYTFYYIVNGIAPCAADSTTITLVLQEEIKAGNQNTDNNVFCDSETQIDAKTLLENHDGGGTWELVGVSSGVISPTGIYSGFSGTETVTSRYVVPAGNGCPADSADVVIQIVAAPNAGEDGSVGACNAFSSVQLSPALSAEDAGGTWVSADGLGGLNASTGEIAVAGVPSGMYTFYYIVNGIAPCVADSATITLVLQEEIKAGNQNTANNVFCDSETQVDVKTLLENQDGGGTWKLVGTGSGVVSPTGIYTGFSGTETVTFRYAVPEGNGCPADSADVLIQVIAAPNAGEDGSVGACNASSSVQLSSALSGADAGGFWVSANGLGGLNATSGEMSISGVASGTYTFNYIVAGTSPCVVDSATISLVLQGQIEAGSQNTNAAVFCQNEGVIDVANLLSGSDGGGQWELVSGSAGTLSPAGSYTDFNDVEGTVNAQYVIPAQNGCPADTGFVQFELNPTVYAGEDGAISLCVGQTSQQLSEVLQGSFDANGSWSGDNTTGLNASTGELDVTAIAPGEYTYQYVVAGESPCQNDTAVVTLTLRDVIEAGTQDPNAASVFCVDNPGLNLNTLLAGADAGGEWKALSGVGLSDASGEVNANDWVVGTFWFQYTVEGNESCPSDSVSVQIDIVDTVYAGLDSATSVCSSTPSFDLNTLLRSQDNGGTWLSLSGQVAAPVAGVVNVSALAEGEYVFVYIVPAVTPCGDDTAHFSLTVSGNPEAGQTDATANTDFCQSLGIVDLSNLITGADAGGTWKSNQPDMVVSGSTADISNLNGDYSAWYVLPANGSCQADSVEVNFTVHTPPQLVLLGSICADDFSSFEAEFTIVGGDEDSYTLSYNGVSESVSSLPVVLSGLAPLPTAATTITVTDKFGCEPQNSVDVSKNCNCDTRAGTMTSLTPIEVCGEGEIAVTHNNNEVIDTNDVKEFVLHTKPGASVNGLQVIQRGTDPTFSFDAGTMEYGTTYYISALVGDAATSTQVDLTNVNGCNQLAAGTPVVWHAIPEASATLSTEEVCLNQPLQLSVNLTKGEYPVSIDYTENGAAKIVTGVANPTSANLETASEGEIVVTGFMLTDANGCSVALSEVLDATVNGEINAEVTDLACDDIQENYTVTLQANGGTGNYLVNGSPISGNTFVSDYAVSGTDYSFTVEDEKGCNTVELIGNYACACITRAPEMDVTQDTLLFCEGDVAKAPITLAGNGEPMGYVGDGNDTWSYVLCTDTTDPIGSRIAISKQPEFAFADYPSLLTQTVYFISPIAGNNTNGDEWVDTDADFCANYTNPGTPVMWTALPKATLQVSETVLCYGEEVEVISSIETPYPGAYRYSWNEGQSTAEQINQRDGEVTKTLRFDTPKDALTTVSIETENPYYQTNTGGVCVGTWNVASVDLTIHAEPTVTFVGETNFTFCEEENLNPIRVEVTGSGTQYVQGKGFNFSSSLGQGLFDIDFQTDTLNSGNYNYALEQVWTEVTDASGNPKQCFGKVLSNNTLSLMVNPLPSLVATISHEEVCEGELVKVDFAGARAEKYSVTTQAGVVEFFQSKEMSWIATEDTAVQVISIRDFQISDISGEGCKADVNTTLNLAVNPVGKASLYDDGTEVCAETGGYKVFVNTSGGTSPYTLNFTEEVKGNVVYKVASFIDGMGQSIAVNPADTGVYQLTSVVDAKGCALVLEETGATLPINPIPAITITLGPESGCVPFETFAMAQEVSDMDVTWSWENTGGESSVEEGLFEVNYVESGAYYALVKATSEKGCEAVSNISFAAYPTPVANFRIEGEPTIIDGGVRVRNLSEGAAEVYYTSDFGYQSRAWEPRLQLPNDDTAKHIIYQTVVSEHGCIDSAYQVVEVENEIAVYIPNAFTPNGDGINDTFGPEMAGVDVQNYEFVIFDRWGQEIFRASEPSKQWNGEVNAVMSQTGVYVYKLVYKESYGTFKKQLTGKFSLLK